MRALLLLLVIAFAIGNAATSAFLIGHRAPRQQNISSISSTPLSQTNCIQTTRSPAMMKSERSTVNLESLLEAGKCEEFEQSPLMCQYALVGVWKNVWTVPSMGLTQEYWQAQMHGAAQSSNKTFVSYLDVISSLPYDGCAQAYARLICPTFFPPCIPNPDPTSSNTTAVLPLPVCRSVCEAANDACKAFRNGVDLVDCVNTISPLTGTAQWPEDSFACTTNSAIILLKQEDTERDEQAKSEGSAQKELEDTEPYALQFACPAPLIFVPEIPDQFSSLACSTTCKKKLYIVTGESEYKAYQTYLSVVSWISFVCVTVLIATILIFPSQRKFPSLVVLFLSIGLWFIHLAAVGVSFIGVDFACKNKTELQYGISWCGFYAWCLFFGGLVAVFWWTYMGFIMYVLSSSCIIVAIARPKTNCPSKKLL